MHTSGSILGRLIFFVYINNLTMVSILFGMLMCAGDKTLYCNINDTNSEISLNHKLYISCCCQTKLSLSTRKTTSWFSTPKLVNYRVHKLNSVNIQRRPHGGNGMRSPPPLPSGLENNNTKFAIWGGGGFLLLFYYCFKAFFSMGAFLLHFSSYGGPYSFYEGSFPPCVGLLLSLWWSFFGLEHILRALMLTLYTCYNTCIYYINVKSN